jgi:hypothetical protein
MRSRYGAFLSNHGKARRCPLGKKENKYNGVRFCRFVAKTASHHLYTLEDEIVLSAALSE